MMFAFLSRNLAKLVVYGSINRKLGGLVNRNSLVKTQFAFLTTNPNKISPKQNFLSRDVEKNRESYSEKSSDFSLEMENVEKRRRDIIFEYALKNYEQICQNLNNVDFFMANQYARRGLYVLPLITIKLNDEKNFVDKFLLDWWENYKEIAPKVYNTKKSFLLRKLYDLDSATHGEVVKRLTWDSIQKVLIESQLTTPDNTLMFHMTTCFKSAALFLNDEKYKGDFSDNFVKKFSNIFLKQFEFFAQNRPILLQENLGHVLEIVKLCKFPLPVSYDLSKFAELAISSCKFDDFKKNFTMESAVYRQFKNTSFIGSGILGLNLDLGQFSPDFWPSYFAIFAQQYKNLDVLKNVNPFFRASRLNLCLELALKFNKLKEFGEIKQNFVENMQKVGIQNLDEEKLKSTIALLKENIDNEICVELLKLYEMQ